MEKVKRVLFKAFTEGVTLNQSEYDELLEELHKIEEKTEIGSATEKLFAEFPYIEAAYELEIGDDIELVEWSAENIEELLEWAKEASNDSK